MAKKIFLAFLILSLILILPSYKTTSVKKVEETAPVTETTEAELKYFYVN